MEKILETFTERKNLLKSITRYSLYSPMFYRTNLWIHSRRVSWLVREFAPAIVSVFPGFNTERACQIALVHDDIEIQIGDIQAGNKIKMSAEERAELKKKEFEAIPIVVEQFSNTLTPELYKSLLIEVFEKNTLESIVVDWADKYDAFGEALHELYAGNVRWSTHVINEYGTIPLPTDYYIDYFTRFKEMSTIHKKLFKDVHDFFNVPNRPDPRKITENGTLHSRESIHIKKNYFPYDLWINTTLKYGTDEDVADLCTLKEKA